MMRITPGRFLLALLIVAGVVLLQAPEAFAIGDDISTGGFSCTGSTASGQLFLSGGGCPTSMNMNNVFSFLVCNFEQLASNVMGHMYCGMIQNLKPAVLAAVTIATLIYGISFTFGLIPATGNEALKFLLKITFIVGFATNADYLIGIAYRGALGAISTGSGIAINLMAADGITEGAGVYAQLDGFLANFFHFATDLMAGDVKTNTDMCKNAIFAVLGTMFVVFPLLAYMGMLLVARIVMTFFRAVFGYIYAIVGITFVLLLAPFFLVFALFKLTTTLFERWLGYLVSFALQVVLLFSFLAFVFSMHLEDQAVVTNLTSVIIYNAEQPQMTSYRIPLSYCTLCDFKVVNSDDNTTEMKETDPDYIKKGKLVCKDSPGKPVKATFATSPDSKGQLGALLAFAGNGILSLIILALVIEHLLKLIPSLAQKLASNMNAQYATQIGGGENYYSKNSLSMPGESLTKDFSAGFERGFMSRKDGNGLTATYQGVKDGLSGLATGKRADGSNIYSTLEEQENAGVTGAFNRYITDPTKFGQ